MGGGEGTALTALDELILPEKERRRYEEWKQKCNLLSQMQVYQQMARMYSGAGTTGPSYWQHVGALTSMQSMPPFLQELTRQQFRTEPTGIPSVRSQPKPRQLAQGMSRPDPEKIFPVWRFNGEKW